MRRWDDPKGGPVRVEISESGAEMNIDIGHVDPRFRGHLSLRFKTSLPDYVFHLLGVRVRT
jgi:hypothetical protein